MYNNFRYVSVAEKKAKAQKAIKKLRKKNPDISPVIVEGRKLAKTWWGKAWNQNLKSYSDYENRIDRGRSYIRHGAVLDLKINSCSVTSLVLGTRSKPYEVEISIEPMDKNKWENITNTCEGKIDSLQDLLEGSFPKELSDIFIESDNGIFPNPLEIEFECSCPDWAIMCKHVAAVLYGIGTRLDKDPLLFFKLRNVDVNDLISKAVEQQSQSFIKKSSRRSKRAIKDKDISSMFNIDIEE